MPAHLRARVAAEDKPRVEAKACPGWQGGWGGGWEMPGSIAGEMIETSGPNICRAKRDLSAKRHYGAVEEARSGMVLERCFADFTKCD